VPKLRPTKLSEAVVEHVLALLFNGKLRTGDRIDRDELADELGISQSPVQEALSHLARDGIVVMPYHRAAVVAQFDRETVFENFKLYGV
jgi:DNA-binding GntR family transcriptional regulator